MAKTTVVAAALAGAVCTLLGAACATMQSTNWTGHRISEVVKKLGQPTEITRSGDAAVYVWKEPRTSVQSTTGFDQPHNGVDTSAYVQVWRFSVDANGRITRYSMERRPWLAPGN